MWICPNCGTEANIELWPVHCSCGAVIDEDGLPPRYIPGWEQKRRQAVCKKCEHYRNARCTKIDLGCRNTFLRRLRTPGATCPFGSWPEPTVRWVRTAELVEATYRLAAKLPPDISRVVGIPRSGMIPAAVLATHLQLPLYTVRDGRFESVGSGYRMEGHTESQGRTLIVDDTRNDGHTRQKYADVYQGCLDAVVYIKTPGDCDYYASVLPSPHMLEWNLFNAPWVQRIGLDLDGVISFNPPRELDAQYLPRNHPVTIITSRPEREREQTVTWLENYNVNIGRLIMWSGAKDQRTLEAVGRWKAEQVIISGCDLYVESEPEVANEIRTHGVRVLCPEQGYLS